jgi:hypothetical protein
MVTLALSPLHVDPRRRRVLVPKRVLRLNGAPCRLTHPAGQGVTCLVQVDIADTRPLRVHLVCLAKV